MQEQPLNKQLKDRLYRALKDAIHKRSNPDAISSEEESELLYNLSVDLAGMLHQVLGGGVELEEPQLDGSKWRDFTLEETTKMDSQLSKIEQYLKCYKPAVQVSPVATAPEKSKQSTPEAIAPEKPKQPRWWNRLVSKCRELVARMHPSAGTAVTFQRLKDFFARGGKQVKASHASNPYGTGRAVVWGEGSKPSPSTRPGFALLAHLKLSPTAQVGAPKPKATAQG